VPPGCPCSMSAPFAPLPAYYPAGGGASDTVLKPTGVPRIGVVHGQVAFELPVNLVLREGAIAERERHLPNRLVRVTSGRVRLTS
jgi:hypothetical protein